MLFLRKGFAELVKCVENHLSFKSFGSIPWLLSNLLHLPILHFCLFNICLMKKNPRVRHCSFQVLYENISNPLIGAFTLYRLKLIMCAHQHMLNRWNHWLISYNIAPSLATYLLKRSAGFSRIPFVQAFASDPQSRGAPVLVRPAGSSDWCLRFLVW